MVGQSNTGHVSIYICPNCFAPNYFDDNGVQAPGPPAGASLEALPDLVARVYDEARRVMTVRGEHAAAMLCRKLLMHVAVEKGAKKDQNFEFYVTYLVDEGFIPKASQDYAKHIKNLGNEATHQIRDFTRTEAEEMIAFLEMLCRSCYEYPAKLKAKAPATAVTTKP